MLVSSKSPRSVFSEQLRKVNGFTLIELLMVISVIAIISSITFGIASGVKGAQNRAKANAELAAIAQGLEGFKAAYGDYPRIVSDDDEANAEELLLALTGWMILERAPGGSVNLVEVTGNVPRRSFVEPLSLTTPIDAEYGAPTGADQLSGVYFEDPWEQPYVYKYDPDGSGWDNFGYVLFSKGADEKSQSVPSDGIIDDDFRNATDNPDNIYVGE